MFVYIVPRKGRIPGNVDWGLRNTRGAIKYEAIEWADVEVWFGGPKPCLDTTLMKIMAAHFGLHNGVVLSSRGGSEWLKADATFSARRIDVADLVGGLHGQICGAYRWEV